jgi:hypothetical protein
MQITYAIPITGDSSGNIWAASTEQGLCRLRREAVECTPDATGKSRPFSDSLVVDPVRGGGGGFWWVLEGGVVHFKDGEVRALWNHRWARWRAG